MSWSCRAFPQPVSSAGGGPAPVYRSLASAVGNTPVLFVGAPFVPLGRGFWAKLEGWNPGGMKDRAALHMIARARERGDLRPGATIIESTSGTTGLGLALAAIVFGHPVTLVIDPGVEEALRRLLRARGVRLEMVDSPHPVGGWQEARRQRVRELLAENPGSYWPNQTDNPDNVAAYQQLAEELVTQVGRVDTLVCSVGTGGHSMGIANALRQLLPPVRLVGVDSIGSCIFGQPTRPRLMRGMGNSVHPLNVDSRAYDEVHWVSPAEAVWTCRSLARSTFVSGGWSTGAVALVARWVATTTPESEQVVAIFPDLPWRYSDTIYDDDYCRRQGLLQGPPPDDPDELYRPDQREVTRWSRCRFVADPRRPCVVGPSLAKGA